VPTAIDARFERVTIRMCIAVWSQVSKVGLILRKPLLERK